MRRALMLIAALLLLSACSESIPGTGGPGGSGGPDNAVGTLEHTWSQGNDEALYDYPPVGPGGQLIRKGEAPDWFHTLPEGIQQKAHDLLEAVDFDKQVVVIGTYHKCMEQSAILHHGDGKLEFEVYIPEDKQNVACAWSPLQVEFWTITLDELGVEDPFDVTL